MRLKYPPNEHVFHILQKQLKALRTRENVINIEKQRRETAQKEIKRAQKLLETRNAEIAALVEKLEELKKTTGGEDF